MSCFTCFGKSESRRRSRNISRGDHQQQPTSASTPVSDDPSLLPSQSDLGSQVSNDPSLIVTQSDLGSQVSNDPSLVLAQSNVGPRLSHDTSLIPTRNFSLAELKAATDCFDMFFFLGEGGFGKVYKGYLTSINRVVAIKQLDLDGFQGDREFITEATTLAQASHPNLVQLLGICAENEQKILVYEYMPLGSLDTHLFDFPNGRDVLAWDTRLQIAIGVAKGLMYLHNTMQPPIIFRDLKSANILLGEGYHPKLSDFGLARVGPTGDMTHVSTRVMGTYGYCAPEYAMTGRLTFASDIYSFGVVLLELITGRKALDDARPFDRLLVSWAQPLLKDKNPRQYIKLVDPLLDGNYSRRRLFQCLEIASMCIRESPTYRPRIQEIIDAFDVITGKNIRDQSVPRSSQAESSQPGSSQAEPSQAGSSQAEPSQAGSNQAGSSQAEPSQPGSNQAESSQPGSSQPESSQPGSDQAEPSQAGSNQAEPSQAGSNQAEPSQAGSNQAGSSQPGSSQPESSQPGSSQPGSSQAESGQAGSGQAESGQTESSPAGSGQPESSKPGSSEAESSRAGSSTG